MCLGGNVLKRLSYVVSIMIVTILILLLWFFGPNFDQIHAYGKFKISELQNKDEIFVRDLTSFDWDAVCIHGPYTEDSADEPYYKYSRKEGFVIDMFFNGYGLVFIKDGIAFKFLRLVRPKNVLFRVYEGSSKSNKKIYCATAGAAKFIKTHLLGEKIYTTTPEYTLTNLIRE